jgi:universal stress protein E
MSSVPEEFDVLTDSMEGNLTTALPRRRILCATDLGFRSDRAVQRAALLARQMNADVLFVHVVSDRQPERVLQLKANRARVRLMVQVDKLVADKVMASAPDFAAVEIHIGKPLQVISEIAKEWNADLIVLAAPVSRRYERLLGTTAERIVRSVACPVLIVNREPLAAYSHVAVATDLSATSARVAQAIGRIGVLRDATAWFIHASDPPFKSVLRNDQLSSDHLELHERRWQTVVTAELTAQLAGAELDLSRVRITAELAPPLEALERIIEQVNPELLVIGTSRWFLLKRMLSRSIAHQLLRRVSCDILAVSPVSARRGERKRRVGALEVAHGSKRAALDSGPLLNI